MIAEEVRAKIIDRYRTSGLSLREVGKEFSVSAPSVRAILIKAGVPITGSTYFKESGMPKRPWHPTNTKAVAKVLAKRMEGMPTKEIAKSTDMTVGAVRKIISEGEIDQCVRDSKGRVAGMLEKALDVAEFHLELNDKAVAMQIIQGSGVLRLTDGSDEGGQQRGGVTFNMALFDSAGARKLLASLAGNRGAAILDENVRENEGRTGLPESVQAVS